MPESFPSTQPNRPLSLGNIVNAAIALYRAHFLKYLKIAAIASLWSLIPWLVLVPLLLVGFNLSSDFNSDNIAGLLIYGVPISLVWMIVGIYCWAKYLVNTALISRLSFQELINRPETVKQGRDRIKPRIWQFLLAAVLLILLFFALYIIVALVFIILIAGITIVIGGLAATTFQEPNTAMTGATIIAFVLAYVLALLGFILAFLWFYAKVFLIALPIATTSETSAIEALGIVWSLTKKNVLRLISVLLIVGLINLPILGITQILAIQVQLILGSILSPDSPLFFAFSYVFAFILGTIANILPLPLWQSAITSSYYDLRMRKEGLDLNIRDRSERRIQLFNRVALQTPESVELEFTLAGLGNRAWALLIDYTAIAGIFLAIFISFLYIFSQLIPTLYNSIDSDEQAFYLWAAAIFLFISAFTYIGYFVCFETIWRGQTPGKRAANIRVIRDDGRPARLAQATLRALLRPVDDVMSIGVLLIILGKQEKRLGDLVGGTVVIQEERPIVAANFPISEEAKQLSTQLPIEADLSQVLPEDFAIVREYLQRRLVMTPEARVEKGRQLANQVKEIVALPGVPKGTTANQFLEAIYLAYQQQSEERRLN